VFNLNPDKKQLAQIRLVIFEKNAKTVNFDALLFRKMTSPSRG